MSHAHTHHTPIEGDKIRRTLLPAAVGAGDAALLDAGLAPSTATLGISALLTASAAVVMILAVELDVARPETPGVVAVETAGEEAVVGCVDGRPERRAPGGT
jgi:hypothetical protein